MRQALAHVGAAQKFGGLLAETKQLLVDHVIRLRIQSTAASYCRLASS